MDKLEAGLQQLGLLSGSGTDGKIERIGRYLREIELWNRKKNLVKASGDDLVVRHVLDSLAAFHFLLRLPGDSLADAGSGAGFPGVPLAVFNPERTFTLIERSAKRADFLRNVKAVLKLQNIRIMQRPLGELKMQFDIVTFRALGSLPALFQDLSAVLAPEGHLFAYKGKSDVIREEMAAIDNGSIEWNITPLSVPFLDEERNLLLIRRK